MKENGASITDLFSLDSPLPEPIRSRLSEMECSRESILKGTISRLVPPFTIPKLESLLGTMENNLAEGRRIALRPGKEADSIAAAALFLKLFKKYRKHIFLISGANKSASPCLDLASGEGAEYYDPSGLESIAVPADFPDSAPYSRAGLIFKLGQARQKLKEKSFRRRYVAFDLETTGKNARSDEIIEIGAVRIKNGELGEEFSALVKPSRPISAEITSITGISNRDLENAPPLSEILPDFLDFIGNDILVAHNIEFDIAFLKHWTRKILKKKIDNRMEDTLALSRARLSGQSHRLGAVAESLGIELKNWHRATADARAAAFIFLHFQQEENAAARYAYFQQAVGWACLGTLAARRPLYGDNAVFLRHGLSEIVDLFSKGEKYLTRRPKKRIKVAKNPIAYLNSFWKKKRGGAVYLLLTDKLKK